MNHRPDDLKALFQRLQERNVEREVEINRHFGTATADALRQRIHPVQNPMRGVPTLERGVFKSLTPMLRARFEYAGSWINATPGHTWLSTSEMEQIWDNTELLEQIGLRQADWANSPPASAPGNQVSVFSLNSQQCEEVYLLWDEALSCEPSVVSYISNYEEQFRNLADFVLFCTQ